MSDNGIRPRCEAITRAGTQCKNYAADGSLYCGVHQTLPEPETVTETARPRGEIYIDVEGPSRVNQNGAGQYTLGIENEHIETPVEEFRRHLAKEVEALVDRLQAVTPAFVPPPFTPKGIIELVTQFIERLPDEQSGTALEKLQELLTEEAFDPEFWQGLWFIINYQLQMQVDMVKRRLTGDYVTDDWGYDPEFFDALRPFFDFLYKYWFRVTVTGINHIPDSGRALIVSNHSGQLPFDGGMIMMSILNEHPSQRLLRNLYATWFPTLPFLSTMLEKIGQAMASNENGTRLLEQDELVGVYPEGFKGVGKLFKDRYKLARFGRGGFVKMALETQSPMIPVSVVGAEETYVSLAKSDFLARLTGFPYFPISLRFPWLGLLGVIPFPTKWYIDFGEPIHTDEYEPAAANNLVLVSQLTNQTRNVIQEMINTRLAMRRNVFLG